MLLYVLICLCLALVGVAGLQLLYMLYLERMDGERRRRLHEVEQECVRLTARLEEAEARIAEQDLLLDAIYDADGEEAWADVIDDR